MVRETHPLAKGRGGGNIPKSLLDAAHVIHLPVLFSDILLADRDTGPSHTHLSNTVYVVLVKIDLESTEVTLGPLGQTPFLDHLLVRLQLRELADDVAVEDGEFSTNMAAFELTRGSAGEGCKALRVCESVV